MRSSSALLLGAASARVRIWVGMQSQALPFARTGAAALQRLLLTMLCTLAPPPLEQPPARTAHASTSGWHISCTSLGGAAATRTTAPTRSRLLRPLLLRSLPQLLLQRPLRGSRPRGLRAAPACRLLVLGLRPAGSLSRRPLMAHPCATAATSNPLPPSVCLPAAATAAHMGCRQQAARVGACGWRRSPRPSPRPSQLEPPLPPHTPTRTGLQQRQQRPLPPHLLPPPLRLHTSTVPSSAQSRTRPLCTSHPRYPPLGLSASAAVRAHATWQTAAPHTTATTTSCRPRHARCPSSPRPPRAPPAHHGH